MTKIPLKADNKGAVYARIELPTGTYAVSVLHDENSNNDMDTNILGIPKEGYGSSNNMVTHLGPPSFKQASFELSAQGASIAIAMRY